MANQPASPRPGVLATQLSKGVTQGRRHSAASTLQGAGDRAAPRSHGGLARAGPPRAWHTGTCGHARSPPRPPEAPGARRAQSGASAFLESRRCLRNRFLIFQPPAQLKDILEFIITFQALN